MDEVERLARRSRQGKAVETRMATITTGITQLTDDGPGLPGPSGHRPGHRIGLRGGGRVAVGRRGHRASVGRATADAGGDRRRAEAGPGSRWRWAPAGDRAVGPHALGGGDGRRPRSRSGPTSGPKRSSGRPAGWRHRWSTVAAPTRRPVAPVAAPGDAPPSPARRPTRWCWTTVASIRLDRRAADRGAGPDPDRRAGAGGERGAGPAGRPRAGHLDHGGAGGRLDPGRSSTMPLLAGLGTLAGPLHGGASQLAYSLLVDAERRRVERALDDTLRWQGVLPGFGHSVYKNGDARFTVLLELFERLAAPDQVELVRSLIDAGRCPHHPPSQRRPGPGRHRLVDRNAAGRRAHPVHGGPGGRLGRPLPRGAGRAAAPLPGPGRLRRARRGAEPPARSTAVTPCSAPPVADLRSGAMTLPAPNPDRTCLVTGASSGIGAEIARAAGRPRPRGHPGGPQPGQARGAGRRAAPTTRRPGRGDRGRSDRRGVPERHRRRAREPVRCRSTCWSTTPGSPPWARSTGPTRPASWPWCAPTSKRWCTCAPCSCRGWSSAGAAPCSTWRPRPPSSRFPARPPTGRAKAFVLSYSHALRGELRGNGVTVTVLCPGPVETGFAAAAGISDEEAAGAMPKIMWVAGGRSGQGRGGRHGRRPGGGHPRRGQPDGGRGRMALAAQRARPDAGQAPPRARRLRLRR